MILFVLFNILNFYNTSYEGEKWNQCNYRVQSGTLKGIYISGEDAYYENLEKCIKESIRDSDTSIYCSMPYVGGYLWAKLDQGAVQIDTKGAIISDKTASIAVLSNEELDSIMSRLSDPNLLEKVYQVRYQDANCVIIQKRN